MIKKLRILVILVWLWAILSFGYYFRIHSELLEPGNLKTFFASFGAWALTIYILASFVRGIVLLPSLPLVLVGTLFFPHSPLLVFLISMLGIVFSGILIYKFSDVMWFDEVFARHEKSRQIQKSVEKYGFWVVALWSFLPMVPTDLICYAAGTVKMSFWKFVLALSIGESICVALLIYGGKGVFAFMGF
jgi:uncharacterized membrane protein YdjX (TVP38/TMEM64 family)